MSVPNKVTVEDIEARIVKTEFHILPGTTTTVCVITLDNGWNASGISACADPANFDKETGELWSRDQAFRKLWEPMGFLLKEKLWQASSQTYLDRLRAERDDLNEKYQKLGIFIGSSKFYELDAEIQTDLKLQYEVMAPYAFIINNRYDDLVAA